MRIVSAEVRYFGPFFETDGFELAPQMNIVVGRNNAGKTALLEALEAKKLPNRPHASRLTGPPSEDPASVRGPYVMLEYALAAGEVREVLRSQAVRKLFLPRPSGSSGPGPAQDALRLARVISQGNREFRFRYRVRVEGENVGGTLTNLDPVLSAQGLYADPNNAGPTLGAQPNFDAIVIDDILTNPKEGGITSAGRHVSLEGHVAAAIGQRTYRFLAERPNLGTSSYGETGALHPTGRNLAAALSHLSGTDRPRFDRYERLVRRVLPSVHRVGFSQLDSNRVQVTIWNFEQVEGRADLARPLQESGTGTGQVLAILYVLLTSSPGSIIIIDEPQSFLHPGAARSLIEVLKEFPQHQYVIATHSPQVISSALPAAVLRVHHDDDQASVTSQEVTGGDLAQVWNDLGVRLSDVFGLDAVLWVEGETEVRCFKRLLGLPDGRRGVEILGVRSTSDFAKRKRLTEALDLYTRLSASGALLPPAVGFLFDRERLSEKDVEDLQRQAAPTPLEFLPRRMTENYLVHPGAIAAIVGEDDEAAPAAPTAASVSDLIDERFEETREAQTDEDGKVLGRDEWVAHTDAARLLGDLFATLSGNRVSFVKTDHGPRLAAWILENDPGHLADLRAFLEGFARRIGILDAHEAR